MRFMLLSLLLLSLFLCFSSVVRGQTYAGAFLTAQGKQLAAAYFNATKLNPTLDPAGDRSGVRMQSHHMTIEFFPASVKDPQLKFERFYGQNMKINVLAYAHDEHGQALVVNFPQYGQGSNPCKASGGIEIANQWPHITISEQAKSPYTAVYSNDLIGRLFASNILKVKKVDSYGKPTRVELFNKKNVWEGTTPFYLAPATPTTAPQAYNATRVFVKVFNQIADLPSIVCWNRYWNDTSASCNPPPKTTTTPAPL